jgi:hypothetical protein
MHIASMCFASCRYTCCSTIQSPSLYTGGAPNRYFLPGYNAVMASTGNG